MAYDKAFYDDQGEGRLASAKVVLPILLKYYKPNSIVDVGCGLGTWLKAAAECGVEDLLGIIYGAHVGQALEMEVDDCHNLLAAYLAGDTRLSLLKLWE